MRYMKQGNLVNFVTHLSVLQLHALNKLQTENCRDHPKFTFYAETILSLQLALATAFKVELKSPGVYTVSYDKDRNYPIVEVYAQYMKKLGRRKSFWRSRREYLDSLITCTAVEVTEVSCSLCPAAVDYTRCPHVVAVRGLLSFPVERQEMADADVTILWSHVSRLLERHTFFSVINLLGAHHALYHGYLPTPGSGTSFNTPSFVNDAIPVPTEINQWVAANVNYVSRQTDSGVNHDVVRDFVGRIKDFMEFASTRKRAEQLEKEEADRQKAEEQQQEEERLRAEAKKKDEEREAQRRRKEEDALERKRKRKDAQFEKKRVLAVEKAEKKKQRDELRAEKKRKREEEKAEKKRVLVAEKAEKTRRLEEKEAREIRSGNVGYKRRRREESERQRSERITRDTLAPTHMMSTRARSKLNK